MYRQSYLSSCSLVIVRSSDTRALHVTPSEKRALPLFRYRENSRIGRTVEGSVHTRGVPDWFFKSASRAERMQHRAAAATSAPISANIDTIVDARAFLLAAIPRVPPLLRVVSRLLREILFNKCLVHISGISRFRADR